MKFETYNLPQGKIMIAFSDMNLSVGVLYLNPKTELAKHNRPAHESLYQVKGKCIMKVFDGDTARDVVLNEGEQLHMVPGTFHIHSNPFGEESITFWKATGNITEIIEAIRKNSEM